MKAADVMIRDVITVKPDDKIADAVKLLANYDISALPVVDDDGKIVGILSEADLIHREEIGTQNQHVRWLEAMMPPSKLANEFAKSHGQRVDEVMATHVVTANENTSLSEIAKLLEKHRIKRIPIVENGELVGIVSRSNLIQALASAQQHAEDAEPESDRRIRLDLLDRLANQRWTDFGERNVIVSHGIVHLWGLVSSASEHKALLALAEEIPGVVSVSDEMIPAY
jgi:CBS-domain-containing membrane protein